MMDKFKQEAYKIRLTPEEKAAMKRQIFASPAVSAASPYFFFDMQFMQRSFVPLLAVLVVLGGTGTAYAAESSLPGDALYTVKVNLTEPLRVALAVTAESRAEAHIALAQKRVEEAEALSVRGTLTATTTGELEANIEEHLAIAGELALEVGHSDPAAALEIEARTRSVLSVRGSILASRGAESKDEESRTNSGALAARVLARVAVVETPPSSVRTMAEVSAIKTAIAPAHADPEADSGAGVQTLSVVAFDAGDQATGTEEAIATTSEERLKARAEEAQKRVLREYRDSKKQLSAEAVVELDVQFKTLESLIKDGFNTEAIQLAVKLQSILEAQTKYRGDVITPLLNLRLDINLDRQ